MKVPTEWGIRVRPGKRGLTVDMLNVSTYADIPDFWPYQTEMPRGAYPLAGVPPMGYSIYEKAELWSDNSADLYEEAIQRRWRRLDRHHLEHASSRCPTRSSARCASSARICARGRWWRATSSGAGCRRCRTDITRSSCTCRRRRSTAAQ